MPIVLSPSGGVIGTIGLIVDPISEDAANASLTLHAPGSGWRCTEFDAPPPAPASQFAFSVDTEGEVRASTRYTNRTITAKILVVQATAALLTAAENLIGQKVGKLTREGGTLELEIASGELIVFDVIEATFTRVWQPVHVARNYVEYTLSFSCKPFGRGAEVTLGDHPETTLPVLAFTETGVNGDVPGTVKITVDDDSANAQQTVLWGLRSRYYDAAASAALFFEAESLTLAGGSTIVAIPAASGGNVVEQATLGTGLVSMLDTGTLTHVGSYRVLARMTALIANTGTVTVAWNWTGPSAVPVTNATITLDSLLEGSWQLVDLGQVHLPQVSVGTHSWNGSLQAASTVGTDNLQVDWLLFLPIDEGSGQATSTLPTAPVITASGSLRLASDGVLSLLSGSTWRRPHKYEGDYPTLPVAGGEGRTVEIVIKAARLAMTDGVALDAGIDDISARVAYTARYLGVPQP